MSLGELIRSTRMEKKLSLRQLETLTGVSYSLIAKIERGEQKPSDDTLIKISTALDIQIEDFVSKAAQNKSTRDENIRFEILSRDNFTCQLCGNRAPNTHIDVSPIVPFDLKGEYKESNLITLCSSCERGRSKKIKEEGLAKDFLYKKLRTENTFI